MTQEESSTKEVQVQEVEEQDPTQNLTPAEEAIMKRMVGEEETQEEAVETQTEETQEDEIIEPKERLDDLLQKQMGIIEPELDEDDPEVLKAELIKTRKKIQVNEESAKLEALIMKFPEHERELIEKGVNDVIKSSYKDLASMETDKKLAFIVSTARGNMKDKIDEVSKSNKSKQRANEQVIKTNTKAAAPTTSQDTLESLRALALDGDRDAQIKLQGFDPVLDRLEKEYLA